MKKETFKTLEYDIVLQNIAGFAVSGFTTAEIVNIVPTTDLSAAQQLLQQTGESYKLHNNYNINYIAAYDDITVILEKAVKQHTLDCAQLVSVMRNIKSAHLSKKAITNAPNDILQLKNIVSQIIVLDDLLQKLDTCVFSTESLKDTASSALNKIRRSIVTLKAEINAKVASYFKQSSEFAPYLQDNIVSVRGGRYVLPVLTQYRAKVPGLVHDQSSSGATLFIEPYALVDLNNSLKKLELDETAEVQRILTELTEHVAQHSDALAINMQVCCTLDAINAKAMYALNTKAVCPALNNTGAISLVNARHPLIEPSKVVAIDVSVTGNKKILLISGPNTGGKTVSLKTVGLSALMAASGIFVLATKAEVSVFDNVFCDIGDNQSIQQSLSTFSAHITNIVQITNSVTHKSLVLLDELGTGTDPDEGAAIALAALKFFAEKKCTALITSHFSSLKEYALTSDCILNASTQFDLSTLLPTYKLNVGTPGTSHAISIASNLGLNAQIIAEAKKHLDQNKQKLTDAIVRVNVLETELQAQKEQFSKKQIELEETLQAQSYARTQLEQRLEKISTNAKAETNRIVAKAVAEAEDLVYQISQKLKTATEQDLFSAREIKNKLQQINDNSNAQISLPHESFALPPNINDDVYVKTLNVYGTLKSAVSAKGIVDVLVGNITIKVRNTDLFKPITSASKPRNTEVINSGKPHSTRQAASVSVNIIGKTVFEAEMLLDDFFISAIASGTEFITIVHGKGSGALGRGVHAYLKRRADVKSYRYGGYGEGDMGVTIVKL